MEAEAGERGRGLLRWRISRWRRSAPAALRRWIWRAPARSSPDPAGTSEVAALLHLSSTSSPARRLLSPSDELPPAWQRGSDELHHLVLQIRRTPGGGGDGGADGGGGGGAGGAGVVSACLFLFFLKKSLPSVFGHSATSLPSVRQKTLGKLAFADTGFAECNTRQTLCRVFLGHCRVPPALGKPPVSGSFLMQSRIHTCIGELL